VGDIHNSCNGIGGLSRYKSLVWHFSGGIRITLDNGRAMSHRYTQVLFWEEWPVK